MNPALFSCQENLCSHLQGFGLMWWQLERPIPIVAGLPGVTKERLQPGTLFSRCYKGTPATWYSVAK
eukprot:1151196-Pelagomonas_calceolata.AAC.4